ncbi:MAG: GIY-YIG nuclease family protein [Flavobacteriaceae bacterium]
MILTNETQEAKKRRILKGLETRRKNKELRHIEYQKKIKQIDYLSIKIKQLTDKLNSLKREEECFSICHTLLKKTLLREHEIVQKSSPWNNFCGVYFLISNKKIVYVGQSKNVFARISAHKTKVFDSFALIQCDQNEIDVLESLYIHLLQPEQNGHGVHGYIFAPMSIEKMLKKINIDTVKGNDLS